MPSSYSVIFNISKGKSIGGSWVRVMAGIIYYIITKMFSFIKKKHKKQRKGVSHVLLLPFLNFLLLDQNILDKDILKSNQFSHIYIRVEK